MHIGMYKQSTSEKIKRAAYELLATKGYSFVSMRDIAKKAGIVVGQLTYHYKTKENLIEKVIDDYSNKLYENLYEHIKTRKDKIDAIKDYFEKMYEEENDTYRILLEFTAQSMWNEKFKIKINKLFEKLTELIGQAYVEEGSTNEKAKVKAKNMISAIMGNNILKIISAGLKR